MRYALTFPDDVEQLVLVNPIGLEDWKAKGVPWQSVDAWYQQELKTTADSIRDYQRSTYYAGTWEREIRALGADAGWTLSRSRARHCLLERGFDRRHGLHAAGILRVRAARRSSVAVDRRQGHDRDRQESGAAGDPRRRSAIIRCWQKPRQAASRMPTWSSFPISGTRRRSRRPMRSTRHCWTGCGSRRGPADTTCFPHPECFHRCSATPAEVGGGASKSSKRPHAK